ncbi:hypothetical protein BSKO_09784 [Bryopsis sp. KO-2023]|nr:hypothetical protein BSKO_09784 [Bryopsis sp. KO-2023]
MADAVDRAEYHSRWEAEWTDGVVQGDKWDTRASAPSLTKLVSSGALELKGKKSIVPGCGRGYDVLLFAGVGSDALGLEISQTAVDVASGYRDSLQIPDEHKKKANFVLGDFFKYGGGQFDVGFDYNFFCAIHPSMRADWAKQWSKLIVPGGELVTLLYPVDPTREGGPPFYTDPNVAKDLLEANGFECKELSPVDPSASIPFRAGSEYLGRWIRNMQ